MSTMPEWPSLWELEPSLRPDHLFYSPKSVFFKKSQFVDDRAPASTTVDYSTPDDVAAAQCRDAAARWLLTMSLYLVPVYWVSKDKVLAVEPGTQHYQLCGSDSAHEQLFTPSGQHLGPNYDEALFAACKQIIEARTKAGAGSTQETMKDLGVSADYSFGTNAMTRGETVE